MNAINSITAARRAEFADWIEIFLAEKGIDRDDVLEAEGPSGVNIIPVGVLVDAMKGATSRERHGIKAKLVEIDFKAPGRRPVMDFLSHLAGAIAA
jgi:hypothetical protein